MVYWRAFGVFPNLKHPRTFNDKICYRRLYPETNFSILSDKIKVRGYIAEKIGEQYLIPHYAVCDSLTLDVYENLPSSFVMKANHGCGYNLLVKEKGRYPFTYLREISEKWLASNFYYSSRELHYKYIKPKLFFEKLLLDEKGNIPKDFKFYCFRKEGSPPVVFIEVTHDRFSNYKVDYYNCSWELVEVVEDRFTTGIKIEKPANMDKAISLALELSEGFSFVRVDFYLMRDAIYFGEMTFTPTAGLKNFKSADINEQWGRLFDN
ncbi:ATP-grasp fold amidoligase family protein [Halomonas sp. WWR20]